MTRFTAWLIVGLIFSAGAPSRAATPQEEVRAAARTVFEDLRTKQFDRLYDGLPSSSKQRVSRENFITSLKRTQDIYRLDRFEIGAVRVSGDLAVADTIIYGHIYKPFESDGKIVSQQYMVKEDGIWRVATGDRSLVQSFLARYPAFARQFPMKASRVYVKRDDKWIDVSTLTRGRPQG